MTERVEITGLRRVRDPKPNKGGSIIIARFDCEARGLAFGNCVLVRTKANGLTAWLPKIEGPEGERSHVSFVDHSLRHAMMLHAREAYRALGGTDAEQIGKSIPNGPIPEPSSDDLSHAIPPSLRPSIYPSRGEIVLPEGTDVDAFLEARHG